MRIHPIFLACLLCCELGALTSALPARRASNTHAEASDEPDLLHMLDFFKGKSDLTLLTTFLKEADLLKTTLKELFDICHICKQVLLDAGKSNVGMRILDKVVEGHAPDIRDMYNLATKGIGNMRTAYTDARKKNKKYIDLIHILSSKTSGLLTSPSKLHNVLYALTGKNVVINPDLLKEVNSGNVKFNVNNLPQINLLEISFFWKKNYDIFCNFFETIFTPRLNFPKLLSIFNTLDTSNLVMVKSFNGGINNDKYAVAGAGQTFVTDPLAEKYLNAQKSSLAMQKEKSIDDTSAEKLVLNGLVDLMQLTSKVLKAAEVNRKVSTH